MKNVRCILKRLNRRFTVPWKLNSQCCGSFLFSRSDLSSAAMTSNRSERSTERLNSRTCCASHVVTADRHDGEVGYNDTSVSSLKGRLGAILGGVRVPWYYFTGGSPQHSLFSRGASCKYAGSRTLLQQPKGFISEYYGQQSKRLLPINLLIKCSRGSTHRKVIFGQE